MTDRTISPLRRRMTEDMTVRGFTASTQRGYIRAIRDFTAFFGRSPDQASAEDLRRYQAAHAIHRSLGHEHERGGVGLALLLHGDARAGRCAGTRVSPRHHETRRLYTGNNIRIEGNTAMSLSLLKFVGQASLVDDAMLPS